MVGFGPKIHIGAECSPVASGSVTVNGPSLWWISSSKTGTVAHQRRQKKKIYTRERERPRLRHGDPPGPFKKKIHTNSMLVPPRCGGSAFGGCDICAVAAVRTLSIDAAHAACPEPLGRSLMFPVSTFLCRIVIHFLLAAPPTTTCRMSHPPFTISYDLDFV